MGARDFEQTVSDLKTSFERWKSTTERALK